MTSDTRPGFWTRLGRATTWLLGNALRLGFLLVLLTILAVGIWLGFYELDRSFNSVVRRVELVDQNVNLVRSDMNELIAGLPEREQQFGSVQSTVGALDTRVASLEDGLAADLLRQAEMLATLEARVDYLIATSHSITRELILLRDASIALQSDLNESSVRIDSLGGEIDALAAEMTDAHARFIGPAAEMVHLRQALYLFRLWELVARTRLRLAENNPGLAAADAALTLAVLEDLVAEGPEELAVALGPVQSRVALAADNLPADPAAAARDLESAWEQLDRLLAALLSVETSALTGQTTPTPAAPSPTPTP